MLINSQVLCKEEQIRFFQSTIEYLGHVVTGRGVMEDLTKIDAMNQWPRPKTLKQIRGFLGITGYYRRFVAHYATIAAPLTELLKKDTFHWTETAAFQQLKVSITSTLVLWLPEFSKQFVLETDASKMGIGGVLMQEGQPLAFFSKNLCPKLQAASTYVRELYAVTEAVGKWRQYLLG